MISKARTTARTLAPSKPAVAQPVPLHLEPIETGQPFNGGFALDVVVSRDWYAAHSACFQAGVRTAIRLSNQDLQPDIQGAGQHYITLFGHPVVIHPRVLSPILLQINALVLIVRADDAGFSGRIVSGSIRIANIDLAASALDLANFLKEVWPVTNETVSALAVGAEAFHLEILEETGPNGYRVKLLANPLPSAPALDFLWQMVACDEPMGGAGASIKAIENPQDRLASTIAAVTTACTGIPLAIESVRGDESGVYFDVVSGLGGQTGSMREVLRPAVKVHFRKGAAEITAFTPGTLFVLDSPANGPNATVFQFVDHDEVAVLLAQGQPTPDDTVPNASFEWTAAGGVPMQLPVLYGAGTDPSGITGGSFCWPLVRMHEATGDSPPIWARIRMGDVTTLPAGDRLGTLSDPFVLEGQGGDWSVAVDVPAARDPDTPGRSPERIAVSVIVPSDSAAAPQTRVQVDAVSAQVEASSPLLWVYNGPIFDPSFTPADRTFHEQLARSSLVFRGAGPVGQIVAANDGSPRIAGAPADTDVPVAALEGTGFSFLITAEPGVAEVHPPAERALVDLVSASGANLIPNFEEIPIRSGTLVDADDSSITLEADVRATENYTGLWITITSGAGAGQSRQVTRYTVPVADITIPWDDPIPTKNSGYALAARRPTVPRDPNHGLVTLGVSAFRIAPVEVSPPFKTPSVDVGPGPLAQTAAHSVLAPNPWLEWEGKADEARVTASLRLHHRNLILEHPDFEAALQDRGDDASVNMMGLTPDAFLRAVRDVYTVASGELWNPAAMPPGPADPSPVRHWLPGATLQRPDGSPLTLSVGIELPLDELSTVQLFDGTRTNPVQSLEVGLGQNWLEFDATVVSLGPADPTAAPAASDPPESAVAPVIALAPVALPTAPAPGTVRIANSAAPVFFSPAAVTSLALSHDSRIVFAGATDGRLWAIPLDGSDAAATPAGGGAVTSIAPATTPSGAEYVITGCVDGHARLWSMLSGIAGPVLTAVSDFLMPGPVAGVDLVHWDPTGTGGRLLALVGGRAAAGADHMPSQDGVAVILDVSTPTVKTLFSIAFPAPQPAGSGTAAVAAVSFGFLESRLYTLIATGTAAKIYDFSDLTTPVFRRDFVPSDGVQSASSCIVSSVAFRVTPLKKPRQPKRIRIATATGNSDCAATVWTINPHDPTDGANLDPANWDVTPRQLAHPQGVGVASAKVVWVAADPDETDADPTLAEEDSPHLVSPRPHVLTSGLDGLARLWDLTVAQNCPVSTFASSGSCAANAVIVERSGETVVTGGSVGLVQFWDRASGQERDARRFSVPAPWSCDNLGVIRPRQPRPAEQAAGWVMEAVSIPAVLDDPDHALKTSKSIAAGFVELLSVSSPANTRLFESGVERDAHGNITAVSEFVTQIRFVCEALKIHRDDGTVLATTPHVEPGRYGFFSEVTAGDPDQRAPLSIADYWPRLAGVPMFVTRLRALVPDATTLSAPTSFTFDAVLLNPCDAAAFPGSPVEASGGGCPLGPVPSDGIPFLVRQAVGRGAVVTVTVAPDSANPITITGAPDWTFAATPQEPVAFPGPGFPGRLTHLSFKSAALDSKAGQIALTPTDTPGQAGVLGRNWPLSSPGPTLWGKGIFAVESSAIVQKELRFEGLDGTSPRPVLTVPDPSGTSVDVSAARFGQVRPPDDQNGNPLDGWARWQAATLTTAGQPSIFDPITGTALPRPDDILSPLGRASAVDIRTSQVSLSITKLTLAPAFHATALAAFGTKLAAWDALGSPGVRPRIGFDHGSPVTAARIVQPAAGTLYALTGAADGQMRLWDLNASDPSTAKPLAVMSVHSAAITAVDGLDAPSAIFASGSLDATVQVWQWSSGTPTQFPVINHTAPVTAVALTYADTRILVLTLTNDGIARLWDAATATLLCSITHSGGASSTVQAIAATRPDPSAPMLPLAGGPYVVTGGLDGTVQVWDLQLDGMTAQPVALLSLTLTAQAVAVDFAATPDGPRLLTVSKAATEKVRVWAFEGAVRLSSRRDRPLEAHLKIQLYPPTTTQPDFEAAITPGHRLALYQVLPNQSGYAPALPQIVQGFYYNFLLGAATPDRKRAPAALTVWVEDHSGPVLAWISVLETAEIDASATLAGTAFTLSGPQLTLTVTASTPDLTSKLIYVIGSWQLSSPSSASQQVISLQLADQTLVAGALEDAKNNPATVTVTGYLSWTVPAAAPARRLLAGSAIVQGPVLLSFDPTHNSFTFQDQVALVRLVQQGTSNAVLLARRNLSTDVDILRSDIAFPDVSQTDPRQTIEFDVTEVTPASRPQQDQRSEDGFYAVHLESTGFSVVSLDPQSQPPIDLCLEPDAVKGVPKLATSVPQLVHRQVQGGRLRMSLPTLQPDCQTAPVLDTTTPFVYGTDDVWRVDPVAQLDGRAIVLQESIFLNPVGVVHAEPKSTDLNPTEVCTENVLVLFRPVPPTGSGLAGNPMTAILSATGLVAYESSDMLLQPARIQDQVRRSGAAGVVLHRILRAGLPAVYEFVPSPFFALVATTVPEDQSTGSILSAGDAPTLDPMLWPPAVASAWLTALADAYAPAPADPAFLANLPDAPPRGARYGRVARPSATATTLGGPCRLLLREATAFRDREPLRDGPCKDVAPGPDSATAPSFFPRNLEIHFGPDKPGAVLHHVLQARSAAATVGAPWAVEPRVDLGLRDPQHFIPPPGAAILFADQGAVESSACQLDDLVDLSMSWKDVLGEVPINPAGDPPLAKSIAILQASDQSYEVRYDRPDAIAVRAVLQVHDRLILFRDADQDFPMALAPGALNPQAPSNVLRLPPRLFVIADEALTPALNGPLTSQDGLYQYYLTLVLTDPSSTSANNPIKFRFNDVFAPAIANPNPFQLWELTDANQRAPLIDWNFAQQGIFTLNFTWETGSPRDPKLPPVFSVDKTSKALTLTPPEAKVAAVVSLALSGGARFQRTVLFGDAVSPTHGDGEILPIDADSGFFRFLTLDSDEVTLALPPRVVSESTVPPHQLRIVKTLTTGETVTGTCVFSIPPTDKTHLVGRRHLLRT